MSDFSDRPLVVGSVTGLRSFRVDTLGRLRGVHFTDVWRPGENTAQCHKEESASFSAQLSTMWTTTMWTYIAADAPVSLDKTVDKDKHRTATVGCGCGYYAYFDNESNPHHNTGNVLGVVEGYGAVTVGARGFRAEKARLVALVDEPPRHPWRRLSLLTRIWIVLTVMYVIASAAVFGAEAWISASIETVLAGLFGGFAWFTARDELRKSVGGKSALSATVRRNYPDVPVYRSISAALAAHPLTPPPTPTPETDDDFWTRSAR